MLGMRVRAASSSRRTSRWSSPTRGTRRPTVPVLDNAGVTGEYRAARARRATRCGARAAAGRCSPAPWTRADHDRDARPPEEPGLPDLLARARLRPLRRESARTEGLQRGQGDAELHAAAAARRPCSAIASSSREAPARSARARSNASSRHSLPSDDPCRPDRRRQHQRHARARGARDSGRRASRRSTRQRASTPSVWPRVTAPRPTTRSIASSSSAAGPGDRSAARRGCTPTQGIAAARRGLHVLVEKPIDVTDGAGRRADRGSRARRRDARRDLSGSR